jgi:hypothetical protein
VGLEVELGNVKLSPEEIAAFTQREAACRDRVAHEPLATMATAYTMLSRRWLSEHPDRLRAVADPVLAEALEVVTHDWAFVSAKVHRALHGRDGDRHDEDRDDDPVQNDWNGSAKVALISLERSGSGMARHRSSDCRRSRGHPAGGCRQAAAPRTE